MTTRKAVILLSVAIGLLLTTGSYLFEVKITPRKLVPPTVEELTQKVAPAEGYTVDVVWGDVGKRLVETGAVDLEKYRGIYSENLDYLTQSKGEGITINKDNAYFWVNTLWALGLVQRSDVLEGGAMAQYGDDLGNFASTGGWTLGTKDALELYSSAEVVPLTPEQHKMVMTITQGIYRPCCDNSAAFPDCNHGMAILGLVELMVSQGFSEEEIYEAALAFNSYWFTQSYVDLAYYFKMREGTNWSRVDPKRVLSSQFSSASGFYAIKQIIGSIPGAPTAGASCGA